MYPILFFSFVSVFAIFARINTSRAVLLVLLLLNRASAALELRATYKHLQSCDQFCARLASMFTRVLPQVPESLGCLTGLRSLRLEENPSLRGPIPDQLASRVSCNVCADQPVLDDTEATMLGSRLDEWFLMPRKARGRKRNTLNTAKTANRPMNCFTPLVGYSHVPRR